MNNLIRYKRLLAALLIFLTVLGLIPTEIFANNTGEVKQETKNVDQKASTEDQFVYEDDAKTIIVDYKGDGVLVKIPSQVKIIKEEAMRDKDIKRIELNEGLETIGGEAFSNNKISGSIVLPSTLIDIGSRAFADNLIQSIDFSKTEDLRLGVSVFQDNKISGKLDLSKLKDIPMYTFLNNKIENVTFSNIISTIGQEAFLNNLLSEVSIPSNKTVVEKDAFANNGRYVVLQSEHLSSDKSETHKYGHIVNPVNIKIEYLEKRYSGDIKIKKDEVIKFNQFDSNNFFSLNEESFYEPEYLLGYVLDDKIHEDQLISFIPNKDMYTLKVYYKKTPKPIITLNEEKVQDLLENKIEGMDITEEELLELVSANDHLGNDISDSIKVSPNQLINIDSKVYEINYIVSDYSKNTNTYKLFLPIDIDPFSINIKDTEWSLGCFFYEGNEVVGLTRLGKRIAAITQGVAVPHLNPYTMETIEVIDFSIFSKDVRSGPLVFGDSSVIKKVLNKSNDGAIITLEFEDFSKLEYIGDNAFSYNIELSGSLPELPSLEYIGAGAFDGKNIAGPLTTMPKLEYIGNRAFHNTNISGQLPELPNLKHIGDYAFMRTKIIGELPHFPKLEHIGDSAFRQIDISGSFPKLLNLRYIGNSAFKETNISGSFPDLPNLEHIKDYAFEKTSITGIFPNMHKLEYIGYNAFLDTNISGSFPGLVNLREIGHGAFGNTKVDKFPDIFPRLEYWNGSAFKGAPINSPLPELPQIIGIGSGTFDGMNITGTIPEMPNLTYMLRSSFSNTKITGPLPSFPKLTLIDDNVFENTKISGELPEMPNIVIIGAFAFMGTDISGSFPKYDHLKAIEYSAFKGTKLSGQLPDLPLLENMDSYAFMDTEISGVLPKLPNLIKIGGEPFFNTKISNEEPFLINSNLRAMHHSFKINVNYKDPQVLLTYDGKNAPDVAYSTYHVVNPLTISFVGKNTEGRIILHEQNLLAREDGDNVIIKLPNISGYIDKGYISVPKSLIEEGVYSHKYTSYKEYVSQSGGARYQFRFSPLTPEGIYDGGTSIRTYIYFSTANEGKLNNGKIQILYDQNLFSGFSVQKTMGIKSINHKQNMLEIQLDESIEQGVEVGFPLRFNVRAGNLEYLDEISAVLLSSNNIEAYGSVEYGVREVQPIFKSTFDGKNQKEDYKNLVLSNLEENYSVAAILSPTFKLFNRDFESVKIVYTVEPFLNKRGGMSKSRLTNQINLYKDTQEGYVYEADRLPTGSLRLPKLPLCFDNPASTLSPIKIKSKVEVTYRDNNYELQTMEFEDLNELNIFVEQRDENIISKMIDTPHYNGRHSVFYDNFRERSGEFKWYLSYRFNTNQETVSLLDHNLDERMIYKAVDPNKRKTLMNVYDKDNNLLLSENIIERYDFDEELSKKIDSIDLKYYDIAEAENEIFATIITSLRDPSVDHYVEGNKDNINRYENNFVATGLTVDGVKFVGKDFAFTNILPDNKDLRTKVFVAPGFQDVSYGKTTKTQFSLESREYFRKDISNLKYTALIEPGNRLENVIIEKNMLADYEVSTTENGYTRIDLEFYDLDVEVVNRSNSAVLFHIETTPSKPDADRLGVYGLLHQSDSDEYLLYNKGENIIEGIDTRDYSYSFDSRKIVNGEYFSVQKLVGKEDYLGKSMPTVPGEKFFYRFELYNFANTTRTNFKLIDLLPFRGDFTMSSYRNELDLSKDIVVPDGFTIEYLNQDEDPVYEKETLMKDLDKMVWSSTPAANTKAIRVMCDRIDSNDFINIDIPMITKSDLLPIHNLHGTNNQFAYKHNTIGYTQAFSNIVHQFADIDTPEKDIKLTKVSYLMGKKDGVIEGVKFGLFSSFGRLLEVEETDKNGELFFKDIPVADYYIEELEPLEGYKDEPVIIDIDLIEMYEAGDVFDLGEIRNNRIDEFSYIIRNVELLDDLSDINYSNLKTTFSKHIKNGKFKITNLETNKELDFEITDRFGYQMVFNPGKYTIEQTVAPEDNGLAYEENKIKYMFEINKFGFVSVSSGKGDTLENAIEQKTNAVYFPNTIDYKTSNINVLKENEAGEVLADAEFTLTNINTGKSIKRFTDLNGECSFEDVAPGLYSLEETRAPEEYIESNQLETISVPLDSSENFSFKFINKKISVNIHKYKVIATNLISKEIAEDIASKHQSETGGSAIVHYLGIGLYEVREVWENNKIYVNNREFNTDKNGSVLNIEKSLDINKESILDIFNNTKIIGHYEPDKLDVYINDYLLKSDFDGTIDIDIVVNPLKGSIYVSKYVIDKNNELGNKEPVNGSKYELYVSKPTLTQRSDNYKLLDTQVINNNNYAAFKDLNPLYKYKVVEVFTPKDQTESNPKEYEVMLRDSKSFVETVIFRNYIELKSGSVNLKKVDGRTDQVLQDVEFEIIDKHGIGVKYITDSQGNITFEDLRHDLAPYTIKETKAAPGYRISLETIEVTEEDILGEETFTVKNYKYNHTPKTGTNGKLPYFLLSIPLIVLAYVFRKKKY